MFKNINTSNISEQKNTQTSPMILGGVVAHHNLIANEIDRFWKTAANRMQPQTIILIGPDHHDIAKGAIATVNQEQVIQDAVPLNTPLIEALIQAHVAIVDNTVIQNEHSVQLHLPWIQELFPHATFVPLIIRSDATVTQLMHAASIIQQQTTDSILIVASVDFSHYLNYKEAQEKDVETLKAIQQFDYSTLLSYDSDHLDSDQSIILLSTIVCPEKQCSWEVFYHGNSADQPSVGDTDTTSYFSLFLDPFTH